MQTSISRLKQELRAERNNVLLRSTYLTIVADFLLPALQRISARALTNAAVLSPDDGTGGLQVRW